MSRDQHQRSQGRCRRLWLQLGAEASSPLGLYFSSQFLLLLLQVRRHDLEHSEEPEELSSEEAEGDLERVEFPHVLASE